MASRSEWARWYSEKMGWSIIPVMNDKKPPKGFGWKEFQERIPTRDELDIWFKVKYPDANLAVITGRISGISVIDIDSYKQPGTIDYVMALFWDYVGGALDEGDSPPWMECVKARTPRGGEHWFFNYNSDLSSRMVAPNIDVKSDGGYVLISPSECDNSRYHWLRPPWTDDRTGIYGMVDFPEVYHSLWSKDRPFSVTAGSTELGQTMPDLPVTEVPGEPIGADPGSVTPKTNPRTNRLVSFEEGGRDETLFHVANTLILGGMPIENVEKTIDQLARSCDPPFPDGAAKVLSALQRGEDRIRPLAQEIRDWLSDIEGVFTSGQVDNELRITTKGDKRNRRQILKRFKDEGIIEQWQTAGKFRKVSNILTPLNFLEADPSQRYASMRFPLDEHELFLPMEKNIIIVAGSPDAGKTAWLLNFVKLNHKSFPIDYFSSEMGALELRSRLDLFPDVSLDEWEFNAYEREGDFQDVIRPNSVNVIDFLEMHDNFYLVGQKIKQIFDQLDKGLAIIALQKNPGTENPLGGNRAREKARMVINLDHMKDDDGLYTGRHKAEFTKCKNWRTPDNPRGMYKEFYIIDGCKFAGMDPKWKR